MGTVEGHMVETPDYDRLRQAYARLCELGGQGLTWQMIFDELRHEGFADDVIAAAAKERLDLIAASYRKGSGRTLRVAVVMFVLGLIAWPITALFDVGLIEVGMVFGLIGGSLVLAIRGAWAYFTAQRHSLSDELVKRFVKGETVTSNASAVPSVKAASAIVNPTDRMEEARAHTDATNRVKTAVFWTQVVIFVAGFAVMSGWALDTHPWLTLLIGLPVFYVVILHVVPFVVSAVANWVEHGSGAMGASRPRISGDNKLLTEVPRAPNLPIPTDNDVIRGEHLDTIPPTPTSSGGRTVEFGDTETVIEKDPDLLPPGVLAFTSGGIAFYPNADSARDVVKSMARPLLATVSSVSPIAQAAAELGLAQALQTAEPELPLWMRRAREAKHHFVIPWPELVKVFYNPLDGRVTLVRETADGARQGFLFQATTDEWPEALMSTRFKHEVLATLREFVELPRMREVLPQLVEKFRGIYGDRVDDHMPEIVREAEAQVAAQELGDALHVLAANLADRLPYYGACPKVRALHPLFFPDQAAESEEAPEAANEQAGETVTPPETGGEKPAAQ